MKRFSATIQKKKTNGFENKLVEEDKVKNWKKKKVLPSTQFVRIVGFEASIKYTLSGVNILN